MTITLVTKDGFVKQVEMPNYPYPAYFIPLVNPSDGRWSEPAEATISTWAVHEFVRQGDTTVYAER